MVLHAHIHTDTHSGGAGTRCQGAPCAKKEDETQRGMHGWFVASQEPLNMQPMQVVQNGTHASQGVQLNTQQLAASPPVIQEHTSNCNPTYV